MKIIFNKKLLPLMKSFKQTTELAELPALPQTLEEAAELINSAPSRESRAARKILLHGSLYGAGPQRLLDIMNLKSKPQKEGKS